MFSYKLKKNHKIVKYNEYQNNSNKNKKEMY